MSSAREARIDRIVRLRDERLKQAVSALEEARALERRAAQDFASASSSREQAEAARRDLMSVQADILDFIEAEEWLSSRTIVEELAAWRLQKLRVQLERALARVAEARIKVRQLEKLKLRLEEQRRKQQSRIDRALEDEIGQRVAQGNRGQR
jgi:flagellar biosynthesis chaperone FliJ